MIAISLGNLFVGFEYFQDFIVGQLNINRPCRGLFKHNQLTKRFADHFQTYPK